MQKTSRTPLPAWRKGGISSDDENAREKLEAKLAALETRREPIKAIKGHMSEGERSETETLPRT